MVRKVTNEKVRVNLNIPRDVDEYIKSEAARRGIAKTHMIIFALSWYRDYNRSMDLMPKLIDKLELKNDE